MSRDLKYKLIGLLLMVFGLILIAYLIFSAKKSIAISAIAGILFGIGFPFFRKGEAHIDHLKKLYTLKKKN